MRASSIPLVDGGLLINEDILPGENRHRKSSDGTNSWFAQELHVLNQEHKSQQLTQDSSAPIVNKILYFSFPEFCCCA
eukprot:m.69092 g.69092  ORF g.69092 m.69092 type:complete len:78 (-) comp16015_c1_seq7:5855-6088(-)